MTDAVSDPVSGAAMTHGPRRPVRQVIGAMLKPLWVTTFRDPVRTGRLRLDGMTPSERLLARCGLVMMALLLVSILFAEVWRRGDLLPLLISDDPLFVPQALVPTTLVAFFLGLTLLVWGALAASPLVRLVVAMLYLVSVSVLGFPPVLDVGGSWWLAHGDTLLRIGYWTPFGALVLSALLTALRRRVPFSMSLATATLRLVALGGFALMVVSHLAMDDAAREAGFPGNVQSLIHSGFTGINGILIPLVFITAVAVVDFATDVSTSLAEPVRTAPARLLGVLKVALLAVVVVKLWFVVGRQLDYWVTLVDYQLATIVRTMLGLALMACLAAYVRHTAPTTTDSAVDEVKERLTLGGAFVLPASVLAALFLLGVAQLVLTVAESDWGLRVFDHYPSDVLDEGVPITASVLAIGVGVHLLRTGSARLGTSRSHELGSGLLFVGAWNLPSWIESAIGVPWGFSAPTIDLAITLTALAWILARWRRADAGEVSLLLAVVTFSWLVLSRGDYLSFLGSLLGLPAVTVVVFGILYTLLSGSGFTTEDSRRLPRASRTLMFIGYLLLSVTIFNWQQVLHDLTLYVFTDPAFYLMAIPLAAWLLVRRIVPRQLSHTG